MILRPVLLGIALLTARVASAQSGSTGQLWANLTLDWHKSPRATYSLDFEPKVLISAPTGQPGWASLDLTPSAEFVATKWADVIGEGVLGRTVQTDDLRTTEATVRGGMRFHLFSRQQRLLFNEQLPKRRVVFRDLVRVEWRHFSYSNDEPTSSTWRFRNRLEFLFPLNRPNLSEDSTLSLIADWEWFVPITDQHERFANKRRYRSGVSYRRNRTWGIAVLYIRTNSRNTIDEPFSTSENILDVQFKRAW
jgi:Protein of unknown function (DUF2490)